MQYGRQYAIEENTLKWSLRAGGFDIVIAHVLEVVPVTGSMGLRLEALQVPLFIRYNLVCSINKKQTGMW